MLEELREAKENQSPEMKHFLCLEKKIKHIETRHAERQQEIQKVQQSYLCIYFLRAIYQFNCNCMVPAQAYLAHTAGGKYLLIQPRSCLRCLLMEVSVDAVAVVMKITCA